MVVLRLVEDSLFEAELFGEKTQLERLPELTRQERTLRITEEQFQHSPSPTLFARNTEKTPRRRGRPPKKRLSDQSPATISRALITTPMAKRRRSQDGQNTSPSAPKRRPVTEEERARALNQAESFTSENPFTTVVMKPSNVYAGFFMGMRSEFAREVMPADSTEMTLMDSADHTWPVRWLGKTRNGDKHVNLGISGGWKKFALDHALEEGDVCIFECIDQNVDNFVLRVHIYRVVELNEATTLNNNESIPQENECRDLVIALTENEDRRDLVVAPTRYKVGRLIGRRKNGGISEYLVGLEGTEEMESVGNLENGGVGRWWVPLENFEDGFNYCRV